MARKGNEMDKYRENLYMWAMLTQVSDVAHGPLVYTCTRAVRKVRGQP
jgi:hypothetical protein